MLWEENQHGELAEGTIMSLVEVIRNPEVGRAARNKLIKHNLRLVLFVINKYFQDFANGAKFQDLCQAGVKGFITAIDLFEPKIRFRPSTYDLFWIRHVSFGLESVRVEIQKAKLELLFELKRLPSEEEIIERVGPERYHEVMKASKSVFSLQSRHAVTQEEFINVITDFDGVGGENGRQSAILRLALDDVNKWKLMLYLKKVSQLDSLKLKESLVISRDMDLMVKVIEHWGRLLET